LGHKERARAHARGHHISSLLSLSHTPAVTSLSPSPFLSLMHTPRHLSFCFSLSLSLCLSLSLSIPLASNVTALLFLWAIMPGYSSSACMPSLFLERALFVREREDGLYRPVTALVSKMVSELIIAAVVSLVASVPVFFACRLGGSFAVFAAGFFVTTAVGVSLGHAIAALAPSMDVANAALPAYVTTLL